MTEQADEPWIYTPKTPPEIEKLAWAIVGRQVFGSWDCPQDMVGSCFMIMMFMDAKHHQSMREQHIAHVYEYIDKAGPRSINGYPSFLSAQFLNHDDSVKVLARIRQIEEFQKKTAPAESA
jgi:hypothetical protein